jgi:hypothetical protein
MAIDIAPILSRQKSMGIISDKAKSSGATNGILYVDQLDILLDGALSLVTNFERDIYKEMLQKEGKSYDHNRCIQQDGFLKTANSFTRAGNISTQRAQQIIQRLPYPVQAIKA